MKSKINRHKVLCKVLHLKSRLLATATCRLLFPKVQARRYLTSHWCPRPRLDHCRHLCCLLPCAAPRSPPTHNGKYAKPQASFFFFKLNSSRILNTVTWSEWGKARHNNTVHIDTSFCLHSGCSTVCLPGWTEKSWQIASDFNPDLTTPGRGDSKLTIL